MKKIKASTISHIKVAEAKESLHKAKIESAAPEFSIAG
jgi:hypothetical protein